MDSENSFTWLHISDFHAGQRDANAPWQQVKESLKDDLRVFQGQNHKIDLVIFSGDLTQSGTAKEFAMVLEELKQIWEAFEECGSTPKLFVIPGNHDLQRPSPTSPLLLSTAILRKNNAIKRDLFDNHEGVYRKDLELAFENYKNFINNVKSSNIPLALCTSGLFPGDISSTLIVNELRIGLVGLNSAWSHLTGGDLFGKLEISLEQLNSVVESNAPKWTKQNNINLLVTHHPHTWFSEESQEEFNQEINIPKLFDIHMFGHMHELHSHAIDYGGGIKRRQIQSSSLFGLEASEGKWKRMHGYHYARINANNSTLTIWPRKIESSNFGWKVSIDTSSIPDTKDHVTSDFKVKNFTPPTKKKEISLIERNLNQEQDFTRFTSILLRLQYHLPIVLPHMDARRLEATTAAFHLKHDRLLWLVSEWDMGSADFLAVVQQMAGMDDYEYYRISMHNFVNLATFLENCPSSLGASLENICHLINNGESKCLILDDVPRILNDQQETTSYNEVLELSKIILQHCENLKVIVKSRQSPQHRKISPVILRALDEPECQTYVRLHPKCVNVSEDEIVSGALFLHTRGEPGAIDRTLKLMAFTPLSDLINTSSDESVTINPAYLPAQSLIKEINYLKEIELSEQSRLLSLLRTLSIFPFGEDIATIRYFNFKQPFHPSLASRLEDLGLVDTVITPEIRKQDTERRKILVVKRAIQEYLLASFSAQEYAKLTEMAISIYFGKNWKAKDVRLNSTFFINKHKISSVVIHNARHILNRFIQDTIGSNDETNINLSINILNHFTAKLSTSDSYRHIYDLCHPLIPILSNYNDDKIVKEIFFHYAKSLRMLGKYDEATMAFNQLLEKSIPIATKARCYVNLAYIYESLKEETKVIETANKIISMKHKGSPTFHAEALLIYTEKLHNWEKELEQLEALARKKGHKVAANNMRAQFIAICKSAKQRQALYKEASKIANDDNDNYNLIKNIIRYAELAIEHGEKISKEDARLLQDAYGYVHNQRMLRLFEISHDCLWQHLENIGDAESLINLYMHGSLLQRLSGKESTEKEYLKKLIHNQKISLQGFNNQATRFIKARALNFQIIPQDALDLKLGPKLLPNN